MAPCGQAADEILAAEEIDQQRRQRRDQHRRALTSYCGLGGDRGRQRDQRRGDRLLLAGR